MEMVTDKVLGISDKVLGIRSQNKAMTLSDLTEASKALFDEVKSLLVDSESKTLMNVTKLFQRDMQKCLEVTEQKTLQMEQTFKDLEEKHQKSLEDLTKFYEQKINTIHQGYERSLREMKEFLTSMPRPEVNVQVPQQPTPNVVLPDHAIHIQVEQLPSQVTVENKMEAPVVNVPQQSVLFPKEAIKMEVAVEQNLVMPKRKSVNEKSIRYGMDGRPDKIIETTTEE